MRSAGLLFLTLIVAACSSSADAQAPASSGGVTRQLPVVALPGYTITEFTRADSRLLVSNPDSIALDGQNVFIDYQNVTAKDCSDQSGSSAPTSTVVEYDMKGKILGHWGVRGHSDGMRIDPSTHLVWTTSCEDGNPMFATIDPTSGTVTPYKFPASATPHGGGFDDLYFVNGTAFIAASNPTLDSNGQNPNPAIDKISLGPNGTLVLAPVLMGNAMAADLLNNNAPTQLTLTDPDSMSVDSTGQLVLVSQGDSELIFVKNPGTPQQTVSKISVGTQLEDTVWPTGPGKMLIVDGGGFTYWLTGTFAKGDVYTQAPNDSGVDNFVATINMTTGFETPIAIGFTKATGLVFVPSS